jgi:hypothetical protein
MRTEKDAVTLALRFSQRASPEERNSQAAVLLGVCVLGGGGDSQAAVLLGMCQSVYAVYAQKSFVCVCVLCVSV